MLLTKYRNGTERLIYSKAIVHYSKHMVVMWLYILTEQKYSVLLSNVVATSHRYHKLKLI